MASGNLEWKLAGDGREVLNLIDRLNSRIDKSDDRMRKLGETSRRVNQDTKQGFDLSAGSMLKLSGIIDVANIRTGLWQGAVSAVRAEFQKMTEDAERAARAQIDVAGALRSLNFNFQGDATLGRGDLAGRVQQIANSTGSGQGEVAAALGTAFSASELSNDVTAQAVEAAFKLKPGDAAFAGNLAAGALDIAAKTGATDVRPIIGQVLQAQRAARVTSLDQLITSSIPAVSATVAQGGSSEEGLELFSALSKLATDSTGESTRTAQINLVEKLAAFEGLRGSPLQRIRQLQGNAGLREAFLEANTFEARFQTPIRQLLSGDDVAQRALANAQGKIGGAGAAAAGEFTSFLSTLDATKFQGTAGASQRIGSALEQFVLDGKGRDGVARKAVIDALREANLPGPDFIVGSLARAEFEREATQVGTVQAGINRLESVLTDTRRFGGDQGQERALERVIAELRGLREDARREGPRGAVNRANSTRQPAAAALGN